MRSGAAAEFNDEDVQHQNPLPVTPLIDCFVLILVFFLACASMTKPHKELDLQLAQSSAAKLTASLPETLIFVVSQGGEVYMENQLLTKGALHRKIREAAAENNKRQVRVDADRRCAAQHLVYLLDLLQFEGLKNVGIRTRD
jgi:biopolymer transport protein ExbD